MKANKSVTWFETQKDVTHFRIVKWCVAVVLALFLNWFYINGLPVSQEMKKIVDAQNEETFLEIEVMSEEEEPQYVEVNPDNPINEPDETNQISDQSQQAAQENVAGPDRNSTPFLKGDDEESAKIIEGQMPTEGVNGEQTPESQGQQGSKTPTSEQQQEKLDEQKKQEDTQPQSEMMPSIEAPSILQELPQIAPPPPTPEFIEEIHSDDPDGLDLKIIEQPEVESQEYSSQDGEDQKIIINIPPSVAASLSKAVQEQQALEEQKKQEETQPQQQAIPQSKPSPMPRPRLSPQVLPGPLLHSQTYAARMGPIGMDAKFSQFGHYLSRMFDTIQMQWYSLLDDVTIGQEHRPAMAIIQYVLDKNGDVVDLNVVETNAGELATILCRDAVESRAPFGLWTQQMVDQLGDQTTITLKFIYQ